MQNSVRFIDPQLPNSTWIVVPTSAAELQVKVMCGKNPDGVEPGGMTGQLIGNRVACSKTFKDYIHCLSGPVRRCKVVPTGGAGKCVQSSGALREVRRVVQVDAVQLNLAVQRRLDDVAKAFPADRIGAVRENDEDFLGALVAVVRKKI